MWVEGRGGRSVDGDGSVGEERGRRRTMLGSLTRDSQHAKFQFVF